MTTIHFLVEQIIHGNVHDIMDEVQQHVASITETVQSIECVEVIDDVTQEQQVMTIITSHVDKVANGSVFDKIEVATSLVFNQIRPVYTGHAEVMDDVTQEIQSMTAII